MLTFGPGTGIAGIARVAIGPVAQVSSRMGSTDIVQNIMSVVVGGVGNVCDMLAGAGLAYAPADHFCVLNRDAVVLSAKATAANRQQILDRVSIQAEPARDPVRLPCR